MSDGSQVSEVDLRGAPDVNVADRTRVVLSIGDPTLKMASMSVLQDSNFPVAGVDDGSVRLITDDSLKAGSRAVLFVDETPGAARVAVDALVAGRLGGFVSKRRPRDLIHVLESLQAGLVSGSQSVLRSAVDAPVLDKRQLRILSLVVAGRSNGQIAQQMHLSEATIKREVSTLLRVFEVATRIELAMKSASIGYSN